MYKPPDITIQDKSYFIKAKNKEEITIFSDKIESDSVIPFTFNWDRSFVVFKQRLKLNLYNNLYKLESIVPEGLKWGRSYLWED